jgi:predicted Ser/Thr protein kinase
VSLAPESADPHDSTRPFDTGPAAVDSQNETQAPLPRSPVSTDVGEHTPTPLQQPLPERYNLIGVLGRGGMGEVLHAFDTELHRQVALKYMRQQAATSPSARLRFMEEARILAQLDHPNVVKVFDRGDIDGRPYFAMEYLDGASLSERRAEFRTSARRAVGVMVEVAAGVQHAHENGVYHRDLKAANVVFHDGRPVVTDFGCARWDDGELSTNGFALFGTASHMAPEVWQQGSKTSDARTDLWALGVMLYQLLAGELPFVVDARTPDGRDQVLTQDPAPIRECANASPGVDDRLEGIVRKALAKNPADRHPTVADFAAELGGWLATEPKPLPTPSRRRWLVLATLCTAMVVFGVSVALAVWPKPAAMPSLADRLVNPWDSITLVGEDGLPIEDRGGLPGFVGSMRQNATGCCELSAPYHYYLQLGDEPLPFPFRLEADVSICLPLGRCTAGVYAGERNHLQSNGKRAHLAFVNGFGPGDRNPLTNAVGYDLATSAVAKFMYPDGTPDADEMTMFVPLTSKRQRLTPPDAVPPNGQPGPEHRVVIDALPEGFRSHRDGLAQTGFLWSEADLKLLLPLRVESFSHSSPVLGHGFGLFVQSGAAQFRNVRLTRLPSSPQEETK